MNVFLLFHNDSEDGKIDLIGVYSTIEKATKNFNYYIDTIEAWYRSDEMPSKENTFNRFGEQQEDKILYATLERHGSTDSVFVSMREVD